MWLDEKWGCGFELPSSFLSSIESSGVNVYWMLSVVEWIVL